MLPTQMRLIVVPSISLALGGPPCVRPPSGRGARATNPRWGRSGTRATGLLLEHLYCGHSQPRRPLPALDRTRARPPAFTRGTRGELGTPSPMAAGSGWDVD